MVDAGPAIDTEIFSAFSVSKIDGAHKLKNLDLYL